MFNPFVNKIILYGLYIAGIILAVLGFVAVIMSFSADGGIAVLSLTSALQSLGAGFVFLLLAKFSLFLDDRLGFNEEEEGEEDF